MFAYKRIFVLVLAVNFVLIMFYINFKGVYWTNSTEKYTILEMESLERLINLTISESDLNNSRIVFDNDLNVTKLSEEDRRLFQFETQLFGSADSGPITNPVNTQLFYADYVKYVKDYRISKTNHCLKYPNMNTIIFVWSRVNGFDQRNAIRQTWANQTYTKNSSIRLLFVLGSSNNLKDMNGVLEEDSKYDDILQFQLMDSYHNCTLKSIGVLRWTQFFCKSIKFLMKTDDDIVVNTNNLQVFVDRHQNVKTTIYGILAKHWGVNRNKNSKWYISKDTYPADNFPNFIVAAHLMTRDSVSQLYTKCLKTLPAFWLEDVYITGILAEGTTVRRQNLPTFVKLDWIKKKISPELYEKNICLGHDLGANTIYKFWANYTKKGV